MFIYLSTFSFYDKSSGLFVWDEPARLGEPTQSFLVSSENVRYVYMSGRAELLPRSHRLLEGRSRQTGQPGFSCMHNENCSIAKQEVSQARPESEPAD